MVTIRIRPLLALTMGGLVLVATGAVLTIALFASVRNTFELLNDRAVLVVDGIEKEVRGRLDSASDLVDGFVGEVRAGSLRDAAPEELHKALSVALAGAPHVEVLLHWTRDMTRRLAFRRADGTIGQEGPALEANPRIRATLESMPERSRQWGPPVVEEGTSYVNFATSVGPQTSHVAFVVAAVSLQHFSNLVAEIGRQYGATAFILYGRKNVLAHPRFIAGGMGAGRAVVPIAEAHDPVLANLAAGRPVEFLDTARRQYVEALRVDAEGSYYLVMYRWLYGYGPEPIAVGAYFPRTAVSDTLQRLALSAAAGILVCIIGVIAAIVLGGFIARPVRRLATSASAIARLDLDSVERPTRSPIREVDEQARAFAVMLDALKVIQTYVPRRLVERLVALGGEDSMGSETRELTVMFTDIVKFSDIAERMSAAETAAFLNRHFGLLAECIDAEDGTIDKYVGDAVMAFWGAPDRMDDHAARAVKAAGRIIARLTADNARRARKGLKPVRIRVGLHSGPALVGNIGARGRVNYTIVGDTVNDAQRLEALGRTLDAGADVTVLMSVETARLAALGADEIEDVGAHPLAGGPQAVAVYRLKLANGIGAAEPAAKRSAR
jgi:adenylate cyclase